MPQIAWVDRYMEMVKNNAEKIAEKWYEVIAKNPNTPSFNDYPKESAVRFGKYFSEQLARMYFAESCFDEVSRVLDISHYAQDKYIRKIPLSEATYSLVLLRRQIWLFRESQMLEFSSLDLYQLLVSVNRILLIFDYAIQITIKTYEQLTKEKLVR